MHQQLLRGERFLTYLIHRVFIQLFTTQITLVCASTGSARTAWKAFSNVPDYRFTWSMVCALECPDVPVSLEGVKLIAVIDIVLADGAEVALAGRATGDLDANG